MQRHTQWRCFEDRDAGRTPRGEGDRGMRLQARSTKACQQPREARKSEEGSAPEPQRGRGQWGEGDSRALPTP